MRWLVFVVAVLAAAALVAWESRLDILTWVAPQLLEMRQPVGPNQTVAWPHGPDEPALPPERRPPNIIVILADDMGFNDVSYYNGGAADGTLMTPNIDALAAQGVAFTNGYAANAVCAPSRASVMTGRYSTRFGFEYTPVFKQGVTISRWMNDLYPENLPVVIHEDRVADMRPMEELGVPPEEVTVAEVLEDAGYYTAHIGKWHLGSTDGMRPEHQGFADSLYMAGTSYLPEDSPDVVNAKLENDGIDRMVWATTQFAAQFDGGERFEPADYLTDYYTEEAVKVIEANRNRPFFLYLAHWAIHNPLQARKDDFDALSHIEDERLRVYAGMIRSLDRGVGRVMATLRELGLDENTLVIFTSDNGGADYIGLPDVNAPYRGWKLTHFEGGTHVPFFARWPARIPAGVVYNAPVGHIDLMPTMAAAARAPVPSDREIDGVNLLPFIAGEAAGVPHRTLFWRQGTLQTVLHEGWKMISSARPDRRWLFDLSVDPTEQNDLAARHPERIAEMQALLAAHNAEQASPAWPSVLELPVLIDKTGEEAFAEGDAYTYFPN